MVKLKHPRAKGNRIRKKCIDRLTEGNMLVDTVEKTGRFHKIKDMFGLFDLTCRSREGDLTTTIDIQVTCNKPHSHRNYVDFAEEWSDGNYRIEQWVWMDREGWNVYLYKQDRVIIKWIEKTGEIEEITRYIEV